MKIVDVRKKEGKDTYIIYFDNRGRLTLHDWSDGKFYNLGGEEESWLYVQGFYGKEEEVSQLIKDLEVWVKVIGKIPHGDMDIGTDTESLSSGIPLTFEIRDKILNKTLEL